MKKAFLGKVRVHGCVDTRRYRYRVRERNVADKWFYAIERLPRAELGTTSELNDWETVNVYGCTEAENPCACSHCRFSGVCECRYEESAVADYDPAFGIDNRPGLLDMYPPAESTAPKKAVVPCDIPGWVGFLPFPEPCQYADIGWYYREYNPDTQEGHGIFGTPDDPQYMFRDAVIDGELKHLHCGFGQGCFWTD